MSYVRRSLIALLIVLFAPVLWSAGVADAKDKISKADAKNISQCTLSCKGNQSCINNCLGKKVSRGLGDSMGCYSECSNDCENKSGFSWNDPFGTEETQCIAGCVALCWTILYD